LRRRRAGASEDAVASQPGVQADTGPARPASAPELACPNCGAARVDPDGSCPYCRTAVVPPPRPAPAPSPFGDVGARFAALRDHPAYRTALTRGPQFAGGGMQHLAGAAVGVAFAAIAGTMVAAQVRTRSAFDDEVLFQQMRQQMPAVHRAKNVFDTGFAAFGMLFVLIGVAVTAYWLWRYRRWSTAPVVSSAALVVDRRTDLSRNDKAPSSSYFVTLEDPGGHRREVAALPRVRSLVREGEMGVAQVRDGTLVGFVRVPV
jgi:hypothetical protein